MKRFLPLLLLALLPAWPALAQRQTIDLPDGWRFLRHDAALDLPADSTDWQSVTVPHCYNALDGQNGSATDGGYYRGPTWYRRTLDVPADWREKRVFIRFEGVFLVADVFLNGEKLGQHRGGFAAFCYELTDKLRFGEPNELRVWVDNAKNPDIAPLSADFTMEGGIYRPVRLLVVGADRLRDQPCISPLDFAGPGVYVTPRAVSATGADVEVETKLLAARGPLGGRRLLPTIHTTLLDGSGQQVLVQDEQTTGTSLKQRFHLDHPHLWNGSKDPYVYRVNVKLMHLTEAIDEVTVPLGFRTVAVDKDKGFLLNGEPYSIYGVNRHQERKDKGWALTDADHDEDFQLIREMGATAVRLAHYQQAGHVHDIADRTGLLLWQEIPVVNEIGGSEAFAENARQQLTEMIRQCSNHPSIMTWSTCNELYNNRTPAVEPLIRSLDSLARELDPTRIPGGVSCHADRRELNRIPEWFGFNLYPGWYGNNVENFARDVRAAWESAGGGRRIAVTEYGAGANPLQHQEGAVTQPKPGGPWHPEEWQSYLHARTWLQIRENPLLWGSFVWAMFDFAVDSRNEGGTPGINDKGLVTQDRRTKKDTFFFYKANWNPEPMVYLTSRRATARTVPRTQVKAYTNLEEAELKVNGRSVGTVKPSEIHVLLWPDVALQPGVNVVEVTARGAGGKMLTDRCEWTLTESAASPSPAATP